MALTSVLMTSLPLMASPAKESVLARIQSSYDPRIEVVSQKKETSLFGCAIEHLQIRGQDPVTFEIRNVKLRLYQPDEKNKSQKAVVILPPTGGVNILDQGYANEFCTSGMTVALIESWTHQDEIRLDFRMHDEGALRAITATRHVIEHLQSQQIREMGLLGTSIGAIAGALVFGVEPRVKAAALIVGSARFAEVVAESTESATRKLREDRMRELGLESEAQYKELALQWVHFNPSLFLGEARDRDSLVITADGDVAVPSRYQHELAEQLGAQEIRLKGGHLSAIRDSFLWQRGKIRDFFLKSLRAD